MNCLRGLLVCGTERLAKEFETALGDVTSSLYLRTVVGISRATEIEAHIHTHAPSVIFLDVTDPDAALEVAAMAHTQARHTQVVGIGWESSREALLTVVRGGMRDLLTLPFDRTDIHNALSRVLRFVKEEAAGSGHGQQLVSFLPAKAGSGASTVALQTAFTISRFGSGRTALIDFDFDCGVIDFMLKLPFGHGLSDLIEYGPLMDETVWSRTVSKFGHLDVVRAGKTAPGRRFTAVQARHAFDYAVRNYHVVCADLPGPLDDLPAAVLAQSSQILLVCTPELSSVYLARKRLESLAGLGLQERVRIILNRYNPKGLLRREGVEDVLGKQVAATIPNDYGALQHALTNGRPLDLTSPLGRCFTEISNGILGVRKNAGRDSAESNLWTTIRDLLFPARKSKPAAQLALPAPLQAEDSCLESDPRALVPLVTYKG